MEDIYAELTSLSIAQALGVLTVVVVVIFYAAFTYRHVMKVTSCWIRCTRCQAFLCRDPHYDKNPKAAKCPKCGARYDVFAKRQYPREHPQP